MENKHLKKDFKTINTDLKLMNTPDWGIENADGNRVEEFIKYHNDNFDHIGLGGKLGFIELIIASMNEVLLNEKENNELGFLFKEFIYSYLNTDNLQYYDSIVYWVSISEKEEFPIGFIIKKMIEE